LWLEYFADCILDELKRVQKSLLSTTSQQRIEPHLRSVLGFMSKGMDRLRKNNTVNFQSVALQPANRILKSYCY